MGRRLVVNLSDELCERARRAADEHREWADATGAHSYFTYRDRTEETRTVTLAYGAEIAAAVVLGLAWNGPGNFRAGDLAGALEVRHTPYAHGSLLVRPEDSPARTYVFVTGGPVRYVLCGYLTGAAAMVPRWWWPDAPRRACWRIPQWALSPIDDLLPDG